MEFEPSISNVIFFDSEFSTSDPYKGEILSIGMVKLDGDEFYIELEHDGPVSDWVEENILPTLTSLKVSREEAREKIRMFVGKDKPYMLVHFAPYDFAFLNKLFKTQRPEQIPFDWIPVDMTSVFFGLGLDPHTMLPKNETNDFYKKIGIDVGGFTIHNALDDAKLLREVYLKMIV